MRFVDVDPIPPVAEEEEEESQEFHDSVESQDDLDNDETVIPSPLALPTSLPRSWCHSQSPSSRRSARRLERWHPKCHQSGWLPCWCHQRRATPILLLPHKRRVSSMLQGPVARNELSSLLLPRWRQQQLARIVSRRFATRGQQKHLPPPAAAVEFAPQLASRANLI